MKKSKGFTLTELLAVIVILGLLAAIAIPVYINISKTVKNNEYESKKKYIEGMAVNYAEEHNITTTLVFTASRLIANGYISAEKYVMEMGEEIPFIANPNDELDNLVCHPITLSVENYEYSATMSDEKNNDNCSLAVEDTIDAKVGIKAYRLNGNIVDSPINITDKELSWVNTDVLLTINPQYNGEIVISTNGNSTVVDKSRMLSNPSRGSSINASSYSNIVIVRAQKILKSDVSINIRTDEGIKTSTVQVKIDKEVPIVNTENSTGWASEDKKTLVYLSDGNGSGPAGVYVTTTSSFSDRNNYEVTDSNLNTALINGLSNGTYYLWPYDIAGNVATIPTTFEIKNVDSNPPEIGEISWTIDSDVSNPVTGEQGGKNRKKGINASVVYDRSRKMNIVIKDNESGMQGVKYCVTTTECTPEKILTSLNNTYTFEWENKKDPQKVCYEAIDNVGNSAGVKCSASYLVDGTPATLKSYKYDNIRNIIFSFIDKESGVYQYHIEATNEKDWRKTHVCENKSLIADEYYAAKKYECMLIYLYANKTYDVTITMYNRANVVSTEKKTISTKNYNMNIAYKLCNPNSSDWCNGDEFKKGVYVEYDGIKFLIYKMANNAIYGVSDKANVKISLINQTCCDHNKCHPKYIIEDESGIWGSYSEIKYGSYSKTMKAFFETLPSNRLDVTKSVEWKIQKIDNNIFKVYTDANEVKLTYDTNTWPDEFYYDYTYKFPSNCKIGSKSINPATTTINDYGTIGKKYTLSCTRSKSDSELTSEAKSKYYDTYKKQYSATDTIEETTIDNSTTPPTTTTTKKSASSVLQSIKNGLTKTVTVSKKITIGDSDPNDDNENIDFVSENYITSLDDNLSVKNTTYTKTAHYGILTYSDFTKLKKKNYYMKMNGNKGLETLLAVYIDGVIYNDQGQFDSVLNRAYGHDGRYSSMSAFVGLAGTGYRATTPMRFGKSSAAIVLPFYTKVPFTDGTGEFERPFKISSKWTK